MQSLRKIAFVVNSRKAGAAEIGHALVTQAKRAGAETKLTHHFPLRTGFLRGCDACCVIGGDGTMLGVVREAVRTQTPIIGVNQGSLGFLTTYSADGADSHFDRLIDGDYRIVWRSLLDCTIGNGQHDVALNDVLIKDEINSRLGRLEVYADGDLVTNYVCDGLVFTTPTGSTAYNLSAGGPIIHPEAAVVGLTPICPHTLSNRTIVFREGVKLEVYNRSQGSRLMVAMDGQRHLVATEDSPIVIRIAKCRLPLVQRRDYSHFRVLRTKLNWNGGLAEAAHVRAPIS